LAACRLSIQISIIEHLRLLVRRSRIGPNTNKTQVFFLRGFVPKLLDAAKKQKFAGWLVILYMS